MSDKRLAHKIWSENYVRFTMRVPRDFMHEVRRLKKELKVSSLSAVFMIAVRKLRRDTQ